MARYVAQFGELTCYMWGYDVLHHLARAVVPPPRLRAKWVVFSAHLRTTIDGVGWALAWRYRGGRNLRNPTKVVVFDNACKHTHS